MGHSATAVALAASAPKNGPGAGHLDAWRLDCAATADRLLSTVELRAESPRVALSLFAVTLELGPTAEAPVAAAPLALADLNAEADTCQAAAAELRQRGWAAEAEGFERRLVEVREGASGRAPSAGLERLGEARNRLLALALEMAAYESRRRFAKTPDPTQPDFPTPADYMLLLERFPLWAEKGWREVPGQGPEVAVFGQGGHEENSLRSLGNILFTYAVLATSPGYDAEVSGVNRQHLRQRAECGLRYMARSHVTGDLNCLDGKRWGNHWQSAWWTGKMAAAAQRLWADLSAADRALVERVVVHEADRHLNRTPPGAEFRNTRSEENAWDSEVLVWAAGLFAGQPHAAAWEAKAREFMMNTLSVAADRQDGRRVDGRPVHEQVSSVNLHDDYTIENHGAYQFCYMACPLHSLSWDYYAYTVTGRRPPEALFHHVRDVWGVIRGTYLYDGRFAYLSGKDWARYVYGLYFIMPPLVVLQNEFGDGDARLVERDRLRCFEWEQRQHGDGGLFSGRFTHGLMEGWPHEYETDGMALLALASVLHGERPALPATPAADFQRHVSGVRQSPACEWLYARSPRAFTSFSWRMLENGASLGLFVPAGGDHLVEWGRNNLCGTFRAGGRELPHTTVRHLEQVGTVCLATTGERLFSLNAGGAPALRQALTFVGLPTCGLAVVIDRASALTRVTLDSQRPLNLHLANDIFNGNRRRLFHATGEVDLAGVGGAARQLELPSAWLNVDQLLGIAAAAGVWTVHDSATRNAPWGSLLYELLTWDEEQKPREFAPGETVREATFVLVAGDAAVTRAVADSLRRLSPPGSALPVVRFLAPQDAAVITLAANHSDQAVPLSQLPADTAPGTRWLPPLAPARPGRLTELPPWSVALFVGQTQTGAPEAPK